MPKEDEGTDISKYINKEISFGGHFDVDDVAWADAFEGQDEGYIMIYTPKYKWIPAKVSQRFPRLMKAETWEASVKWTEGESMATLTVKGEEE